MNLRDLCQGELNWTALPDPPEMLPLFPIARQD